MSVRVTGMLDRIRHRARGVLKPIRKGDAEFAYWKERQQEEGVLCSRHYERIYTTSFGLEPDDFRGKRVLDIGCGPRGSLEWATEAAERVGLDPSWGVIATWASTRTR